MAGIPLAPVGSQLCRRRITVFRSALRSNVLVQVFCQLSVVTQRWGSCGGDEESIDGSLSTSDTPSVSRSSSAELSQESSPMVSQDAGHPSLCVSVSLDPTSPQDSAVPLSALEDAVVMPSNVGVCALFNNGDRSTGCLPVTWCGFHAPLGGEKTKPYSDGCVPQESRPVSCTENSSKYTDAHPATKESS